MRLWMSIWKLMMALNAETKRSDDDDSERQTKKWLWTPNWKMWHDDSECRNRGCDSECRKPWMNGGFERQTARKQCGRNMPQCGMSLQISIRWKWLKGTLRASNDAPLRAHLDEELRSNGQWGEYHISRPSDGNCNGYVRERSPPRLNKGNMPQYGIRCIQSVPMNHE